MADDRSTKPKLGVHRDPVPHKGKPTLGIPRVPSVPTAETTETADS
jgi:hypothetical protein